MEEARSPLESPFCAHLRSKKWYFRTGPPLVEGDILDASNHCWCNRTWTALGPDNEPADPSECRSARSCFEAMFAPASPKLEA